MPANQIGTMRRPAFGGVAAHSTLTIINTGTPINLETETVLIVSSHQHSVVVRNVEPTQLTIENTGPVPAVFSVFVIPRDLADAVRAPWRQLWSEVVRRVKGRVIG